MLIKETSLTVERKTVIRPMTPEESAAKREAGRANLAKWFARREAMKEALGA